MVPWFPWFLEFVPGYLEMVPGYPDVVPGYLGGVLWYLGQVPGQLSSVPGNCLIPWHLGVGPTLRYQGIKPVPGTELNCPGT